MSCPFTGSVACVNCNNKRIGCIDKDFTYFKSIAIRQFDPATDDKEKILDEFLEDEDTIE